MTRRLIVEVGGDIDSKGPQKARLMFQDHGQRSPRPQGNNGGALRDADSLTQIKCSRWQKPEAFPHEILILVYIKGSKSGRFLKGFNGLVAVH